MNQKPALPSDFLDRRETLLSGVPDGFDGKVLADLAALSAARGRGRIVFVARDGHRMADVEQSIRFFAPEIDLLQFPAWDCLPYDRVSPHPAVLARRMATLVRLSQESDPERPSILLTTVNAAIQRVPPHDYAASRSLSLSGGMRLRMDALVDWVEGNGFSRTGTVREVGEYAVRGGIVDLFAADSGAPVRLDFFGDTLESIRSFDLESQRTTGQLRQLELVPTSEVTLSPESVRRFREGYVSAFGAPRRDDLLYQAISEGRRHAGLEHWLPLFHESVETIFDYAGQAPVVVDHLAGEAVHERLAAISDHYGARRTAADAALEGGVPYLPLPPERLYLDEKEWSRHVAAGTLLRIEPFASPEPNAIDLGGRQGRTFAAERQAEGVNLFDVVIAHIGALKGAGKRVAIACWSEGTRDRMGQVLADRGLTGMQPVASWPEALALPKSAVAMAVLAIESGFETAEIGVIGEQDILGDRLIRSRKRARRGSEFLAEVTSLTAGDLVVHVDHGIGRFAGLATIEAAGAPHDCLELTYAGGDRLYLPVENIELLSRYGAEETDVPLDKLGGTAWQARRARMKRRIRDMAAELIRIAAARAMRAAPAMTPPEGLYDEFAARFPYEETEDQLAAIDAVMEDLASGKPMDRLICGDVGFGKTEVALRAAFVTALSGKQVAVVVPTTLLARQHVKTFTARFGGFPVKIGHMSRLASAKERATAKKGIADGSIDIVIGTHALLAKDIAFRDLGLLIIDEEQHFGVRHKERLKELRADVHVLTLTATPIPRTLQLALTGVRELSLIGTPPIDRLAVRTFVSPFDPLIVREALLRERYRGGQTFYVCPRISDLGEAKAFLDAEVPEVKVAVAHGQLAAGVLDDIMNAFYDGAYDVLLSTSIVESGLDIPTANTLIVHRSDMFGLAQLYQLRGRVGRSKTRAYALFTLPQRTLTANVERRLKVLQSLDTLGAGFQLASHDLDIRGAGNLLGEEQSGHIREVGYELYQQMLEEAVASLKDGGDTAEEGRWSPQITLGMPVMIPEGYVPDLQVRMSLYRRLADLGSPGEIDAFGAEMIDRFGALPEEVEHLLKIVYVKILCRAANVEKVEAGPKGVVIAFRGNVFANPAGLLSWIASDGEARVRPDQKVVVMRDWATPEERMRGTKQVLETLVTIAERAKAA